MHNLPSALGVVLFLLLLTKVLVNVPGSIQGYETGVPYHRYVTIVGLLYCLCFARNILPILKNSWPYISFVIFASVSIAWAQDPNDAFQVTRYFAATFVGAICAVAAIRGNLRVFFQWATPYLLAVLVASIFLCRTFPGTYIEVETGRWLGVTSHPNALGVASLATIWCSLSLFALSQSVVFRLISVAGIAAALICLKGTDSMTSTISSLGVALTFVYILFISRLKKGWRSFLIGASLLIFFSVVILMVYWPEVLPIQQAFDLAGRDRSFTGRTTLWNIAFELFHIRPVFGWGFDHLRDVEIIYGVQLRHLHNGYLDLLVRGGLVGVTLVLITIMVLAARILRTLSTDRIAGVVLASGLGMILIHNVAEGSFGTGMNTLWLLYSFLFMHTGSRQWRVEAADRTLPARPWKNIVA